MLSSHARLPFRALSFFCWHRDHLYQIGSVRTVPLLHPTFAPLLTPRSLSPTFPIGFPTHFPPSNVNIAGFWVKMYPVDRACRATCPRPRGLPRDGRHAKKAICKRLIKLARMMDDLQGVWNARWDPKNDMPGLMSNMHRFMVRYTAARRFIFDRLQFIFLRSSFLSLLDICFVQFFSASLNQVDVFPVVCRGTKSRRLSKLTFAGKYKRHVMKVRSKSNPSRRFVSSLQIYMMNKRITLCHVCISLFTSLHK